MQKTVRMMASFISILAVSGTLLMASESGSAGKDDVLLFLGQNPKPKTTGAVAYKVEKQRFEALPEWGPDTDDAPPPLKVSTAVAVASSEIAKRYSYEAKRLQLSEVVLLKAPVTSRNVWYYVVAHQVNIAKNPFHPQPSDYVEIRVVVLMDGKVVEPSNTELSRQIRFQGSDVTMEKKGR